MKLIAKKQPKSFSRSETVLIFLSERDIRHHRASLPESLAFVGESTDASFFRGTRSETLFLPFARHPRVILCGIGKPEEADAESLRRAAAAAVNLCRDKSLSTLQVIPPVKTSLSQAALIAAIAEGLYLGNYQFDAYKTVREDHHPRLVRSAVLLTDHPGAAKILRRVSIVSRNTILCRDLVNETSEKSDSRGIARVASGLASLPGVSCRVYGKRDLEKMKMGLLLAVNRGSKKPPHLVVLTYRGNRAGKKFFALIGKGITFDTGGLNLKPTGHIEDMRTDLAGAAAGL